MIEKNQNSVNEMEVETEMNWDNLAAQASAVDDVISPQTSQSIEESKEDEPEVETGELVTEAVQVLAEVFAPNWNVQKEESEKLGTIYGALLDKYFPDSGIEKFGLELTAILVTGMIVKSRKGIPLRLEKEVVTGAEEKSPPQDTEQIIHQEIKSDAVLKPKKVKNA